MLRSCQDFVKICQVHVRVMSRSCQGHARVLSGSCHGYVRVMSGSCQSHIRVMSGHVRVMSESICVLMVRKSLSYFAQPWRLKGFSVLFLLKINNKNFI